MKALHERSLFIFRRDLRLQDNTGLDLACAQSTEVLPLFVLDDRQVGSKNPYRSEKAVGFMAESLLELDQELQKRGSGLILEQGKPHEVVRSLIESRDITAVYVNMDYTPFSKERDAKIELVCKDLGVDFIEVHDALLTPPGSILTATGTPFKVYSAFLRTASKHSVAPPTRHRHTNFIDLKGKSHAQSTLSSLLDNSKARVKGGRSEGLKLLKNLEHLRRYDVERDIPALAATSRLSAHHKFGTISIRETYHKAKELKLHPQFIKELYWRDFFTHIADAFPYVFTSNFYPQFDGLKWKNSEVEFEAWCQGKTGFPLVDAGMRQLNETGYMHNRVRMVVASFLVKDLHIDWRWGERYFANQLVDYDPCVNNGSWQWVAGTGVDAQPYFRVFNPWLQSKRFDPEAQYIKKWIPELEAISPAKVHAWFKHADAQVDYPAPIVDHGIRAKEAIKRFGRL